MSRQSWPVDSPAPVPVPVTPPPPTLNRPLRERLALGAYNALMRVSVPLLWLKLKQRANKEPLYGQHFAERLGFYAVVAKPGAVWIHAVSLGETRAAGILLAALRQAQPDVRLLLTHGTATGRQEGAKLLRPGDVQVWQPWDTPGAVRRFLRHFQPHLGLLMETELWPNLILQCHNSHRHGQTPLWLVNARLSERSQRKAQRVAALARPVYAALTAVLAQSEADAQRLRALGAPVQAVLGNLKFDATPDAAQRRAAQAMKASPVLLFASSREGEETLFLQALATLPKPWGFWPLIVPRHPQRFDEVAQLIAQQGHSLARRSTAAGQSAAWFDADLGLGDSMGEMAFYFGLADVALLGGSFAPLGGQNLIEAAACGCPVVMGPHTFNFAEASTLAEQAGAAWRVLDVSAAVALAARLLSNVPLATHVADEIDAIDAADDAADDADRLRQGKVAALAFAAAHRGATAATVQALEAYLRNPVGLNMVPHHEA
jgi:3-deoxy-D-manno-octulosonic-acid transferase